jgi:hypothetical protein
MRRDADETTRPTRRTDAGERLGWLRSIYVPASALRVVYSRGEFREVPREAKQAPLRFVMQAAELGSPASLERAAARRAGWEGWLLAS